MPALPRFADPRTGGCGNRIDDGFCGVTPAPYELRLGEGGRAVARLCEGCADTYQRKIDRYEAQGLTFSPQLVVERVELET